MKDFNVSVMVRNEKQLEVLKNFDIHSIYTDNIKLVQKYSNLYFLKIFKENSPKIS